jgi:hypothetical protein
VRLVNWVSLVFVQKHYRVLDAHNVLVAFLIDLVDHRGKCGRLATPSRARDQDKPAGLLRHLLYSLGQPELTEAQDIVRVRPEGHPKAPR